MFRKILAFALGVLWVTSALSQAVFDAAYGVQNEFPFVIWSADGTTLDVDESDDGNDALVSCNAGDAAESTNTYTDEGSRYQIVLTAAEMQCEYVTVEIVEAVNTAFFIQTYGHASSRVISQPIAAPGSDTGLFIAGTNAATTVTTALTTTFTGNVTGSVGSVTGAVGSVTGAVGSVTGLTASDVGTIKNKTDQLAFTLAGDVDANMQSVSGDTTAADELEAIYEGVCGQFGRYGVQRGFGCTAVSYTHSTGAVVLDSASAFADGALQNALINLCGNTSGCQAAQIASNLLTGDVVTLQDPLEDDIEGETITFTIFGTPQTTGGVGTPLTAAETEAEVNDALVALELDQLLSATYNPAAEPAADSLFGDLTESDSGVTRFTTNSLEQAPTGSGETSAAIAEAVWEYLVASCSAEAGSLCELVNGINSKTTNLPTDPADASVVATAIGDVPTVSEFEARTIVAANYFDPAADSVLIAAGEATEIQAAVAAALDAEDGANFTAIPAIPADFIAQFACDSGDADTCVDTGLTAADGFYRGDALRSMAGTTIGMERCIVASDQSDTSVTVAPPFPASLGTGTVQRVASAICAGVDPTYTP